MSTRMLIDTRHSEETRVAVVKGSRVEEFDYESVAKKQLKGNIYLARVTRVEPSLQACFVEYGGNRHGFLAFSEIHPDYYQIPAKDREELLAEGEEYIDSVEADYDSYDSDDIDDDDMTSDDADSDESNSEELEASITEVDDSSTSEEPETIESDVPSLDDNDTPGDSSLNEISEEEPSTNKDDKNDPTIGEETNNDAEITADIPSDNTEDSDNSGDPDSDTVEEVETETEAETIENDDLPASDEEDTIDTTEARELRKRRYFLRTVKRRYKIQEVIKRRQVMLIQVVKEERGNKGAALTTYLSLAGRFCVLMPNSTHSGGISRKISSHNDRRRLKSIITSLRMPDDMGLIVRTAGMKRSKEEIKRDYDYLLRMWNAIRDLTLKSMAPALIYEEGNLIKRAIRDLYNRDIDEILVEGRGFKLAKDFMGMLMPTHAEKVKNYSNRIPLFHRYQVEGQLASMYDPVVQLKSGGYVVINPTEALISIDVNSGRATKEKSIEETAVKTNLEAAEELARQLRLRDMAGLVVIDFIDMEDRNNIRSVERKMKDVLKHDRARIQVGKISSFGLMEMSRQRLRPNVLEAAMHECPHCKGAGVVPTVESAALTVLRELEEEGIRSRSSVIRISLKDDVAAYILNNKKRQLVDLEYLYKFRIEVVSRFDFGPSQIEIDREAITVDEKPQQMTADEMVSHDNYGDEPAGDTEEKPESPHSDDGSDPSSDKPKKRRRRRRRRPGRDSADTVDSAENSSSDEEKTSDTKEAAKDDMDADDEKSNRRRRGRRGGRRRRREDDSDQQPEKVEAAEAPVADTNDEDEKPKKRRGRPKKAESAKPAEGEKPDSIARDSGDEKPKPKRGRPKKSDANAENDTTEDQKPAAKKPAVKKTAPKKAAAKKSPAKKPAAKESGQGDADAPAPTSASASVPSSGPADAAGDKDDGPKRKGWWQRTFG